MKCGLRIQNMGPNLSRPKEGIVPDPQAPLRAQVHEGMRFLHYARRTEDSYWQVLHQPLGDLGEWARAERPKRLAVVLTRAEVKAILDAAEAEIRLPLQLLYGSGLRLIEMLRLRVKDLHLDQCFRVVRAGKGDKHRRTVIPEVLVEPLREQLRRLRVQHAADVKGGFAGVWLPNALESKYSSAPQEWAWQWLFPTPGLGAAREQGRRAQVAASSGGGSHPTGNASTGAEGGGVQAGDTSYSASQLRHPSSGIGDRHQTNDLALCPGTSFAPLA